MDECGAAISAAALVAFIPAACGDSDDPGESASGCSVDPDSLTCTQTDEAGPGSPWECPLIPALNNGKSVKSVDLADFPGELKGVSDDTPVMIQAFGGGSEYPNSGGSPVDISGGVAQTVTSVSDLKSNFGTTELYL